MSIGSRHEIKTDYYTIQLSNPNSVFTIQVCSSTCSIYQPFGHSTYFGLLLNTSKKNFSLKLKNDIKVSSGTSLGPSIGPDSGFSPLPLGPCNFSFATKA